MFRRRLSLVLILLAAAVTLQGLAAVVAVREAERQVVRGRVASDTLQRFVELSSTKQRLRAWATQHQIGAGGAPAERDTLVERMQAQLQSLQTLARDAETMGLADEAPDEHAARLDALRVLTHSVAQLGAAVREMQPLTPEVQASAVWDALTAVFEQSEGRDLRELVAQSIAREQAAMQRERAAADDSLARMRALWMGTALALALGALAATLYFGRALRRPLHALADGARALQQGQLHHRIDLPGRNEFADAARSMNAMADELERHRQREQQQRQVLDALALATALAAEQGVPLQQSAEDPMPEPLTVFGDAQRLTQLVLLLLDNAIRYSHPGGAVHWSLGVQDGHAELRVHDQGIGIPAPELAQVFERHFRGSAARQHRASGSGLGLPIARALAQVHGGTLELHSPWPADAQGGTCAVLRLPLWQGPLADSAVVQTSTTPGMA